MLHFDNYCHLGYTIDQSFSSTLEISLTYLKDTAVILFARSAGYEAYSKRMFSRAPLNSAFWDGIQTHVLKTVRDSNLDYFHFDQDNQIGDTFGERLTNAMAYVFGKHYKKVIIIGNDCLEISVLDLQFAANELEKTPLVIGPDLRGGSYLLGVDQSIFNPEQFKHLPWKTDGLFSALTSIIDEATVLKSKSDLNLKHELQEFIKTSYPIKRLVSIISTVAFTISHSTREYSYLLSPTSHRGPPYAL